MPRRKGNSFQRELCTRLFRHWEKSKFDPEGKCKWGMKKLVQQFFPDDESKQDKAYNYAMRNGKEDIIKLWKARSRNEATATAHDFNVDAHRKKISDADSSASSSNSMKQARAPSDKTVNAWKQLMNMGNRTKPKPRTETDASIHNEPDELSAPQFGTRDRDVIEYLKNVRRTVTDATAQAAKNNEKYPYSALWIHPPNPLVLSRVWNTEERGRMNLPKIFVFDPSHWPDGGVTIFCDGCLQSECTEPSQWQSDGLGYKRVHDISCDSEYYILFRKYRCINKTKCAHLKNCDSKKHSFSILNPKTFSALPFYVREIFPAVLRGAKVPAIDKTLDDLLYACCADSTGMSSNSLAKCLEEVAYESLSRKKAIYYSRASTYVEGFKKNVPEAKIRVKKYKDIPIRTPQPRTLSRCLEHRMSAAFKNHVARLALINPCPGGVPGILKSDTSFKVKKSVRFGRKSSEAFAATESVMDGYGQVFLSTFLSTQSQPEREVLLKQLADRLKGLGATIANTFIDNCCTDAALYERALAPVKHQPTAKDSIQHSTETELSFVKLEDLGFADAVFVHKEPTVNEIISRITDEMNCGSRPRYCGIDLEWTPHPSIVPDSPNDGHTDVISIAFPSREGGNFSSDSKVYVFFTRNFQSQVKSRQSVLPSALDQFLKNPQILKVGLHIGADIKFLTSAKSFPDALVTPTLDVRNLAKQLGVVALANGNLADLSKIVLQVKVDKQHQLSNWSKSFGKNKAMLNYAGLDAALHLTIYKRLLALADSNAMMKCGDRVIVLDRSKNVIAALGTISDFRNQVSIDVDTILTPKFAPFRDGKGLCHMQSNTGQGEHIQISIASSYVTLFDKVIHSHRLEQELSSCSGGNDRSQNSSSPNTSSDKFVKLDPYHAITRVLEVLPKNHGAFKRFSQLLSQAIFTVSSEDKASVLEGLKLKNNWSDEQAVHFAYYNNAKILRKCRRVIPEPAELLKRLNMVFEVYFDAPDHKTRTSLFNEGAVKAWKNFLIHVEKGCLSDPPGMPMYFMDLHSKIKSKRGTSQLENYHLHLRRSFHHGYNISPKMAVLMLAELVSRWNARVQSQVMGMPNYGCYNFSLLEQIVLWAESVDVVEFPHLTLTADYEIDSSHNFFVSTLFQDNVENLLSGLQSEAEEFDLDSDSNSECSSADEDFTSEILEQIHEDIDIDTVTQNLLNVLESHVEANPETNIDRSVRNNATPTEVQVNGERSLVDPGAPSYCEVALWRELYPIFEFTTSAEATMFVTAWNKIVHKVHAHDHEGKRPILRPLTKEVAEALCKTRAAAANIILTLEPLKAKDKFLKARLSSQQPTTVPPVEKITLAPRQLAHDGHKHSPTVSSYPLQEDTSAVTWAHEREVQEVASRLKYNPNNKQFCTDCGHLRYGIDTHKYHTITSNGFGKHAERVCLLKHTEKCAKVVRSRDRKLLPDFQTKSIEENLSNPHGCQFCLGGVKHPQGLFDGSRAVPPTSTTYGKATDPNAGSGMVDSGASSTCHIEGLSEENFSDLHCKIKRCHVLMKDIDVNEPHNLGPYIIEHGGNYNVNARSFLALTAPNAWVDHVSLDCYASIINTCFTSSGVYCAPTSFMNNIRLEHNLQPGRLNTMAQRFRQCELAVIPVHGVSHWSVGVVNFRSKCLEHYDSMGTNTSASKDFFSTISKFLEIILKQGAHNHYCCSNISTWRHMSVNCPQQKNSHDCGVFSLCCMRCRASGKNFDYSQNTMQDERLRLAFELIQNDLIDRSQFLTLSKFSNNALDNLEVTTEEVRLRQQGMAQTHIEEKWKCEVLDTLKTLNDTEGNSCADVYDYVRTMANGDCLFDAVRTGLRLNIKVPDHSIKRIRKAVVNFLQESINQDDWLGCGVPWHQMVDTKTSSSHFLQQMEQSGTYQESVALMALATIYKVAIQVIAVSRDTNASLALHRLYIPPSLASPPSSFITLGYLPDHKHYVCLRKKYEDTNQLVVGAGLLNKIESVQLKLSQCSGSVLVDEHRDKRIKFD